MADSPGIYRADDIAFAVQLDPAESELTPIPLSEMPGLGLPLDDPGDVAALAESTRKLSNIDQERRQKWAWWLILAAVVFFLAETIYAGFAGKRPTLART